MKFDLSRILFNKERLNSAEKVVTQRIVFSGNDSFPISAACYIRKRISFRAWYDSWRYVFYWVLKI